MLKDYVPPFLIENKEFRTLYSIQQTEIDKYNNAIKDIVNQCFIDTATWGLKYWEELLSIPIEENKPLEFRRSTIKAKIRGQGTVTVDVIKNVSESFSNGEVAITENIAPYTFEIKFIGARGIPPNLQDLKNVIEEIKPAHLVVEYKFTYTTWNEVKNTTWEEVKKGTWGELKTRKVI